MNDFPTLIDAAFRFMMLTLGLLILIGLASFIVQIIRTAHRKAPAAEGGSTPRFVQLHSLCDSEGNDAMFALDSAGDVWEYKFEQNRGVAYGDPKWFIVNMERVRRA